MRRGPGDADGPIDDTQSQIGQPDMAQLAQDVAPLGSVAAGRAHQFGDIGGEVRAVRFGRIGGFRQAADVDADRIVGSPGHRQPHAIELHRSGHDAADQQRRGGQCHGGARYLQPFAAGAVHDGDVAQAQVDGTVEAVVKTLPRQGDPADFDLGGCAIGVQRGFDPGGEEIQLHRTLRQPPGQQDQQHGDEQHGAEQQRGKLVGELQAEMDMSQGGDPMFMGGHRCRDMRRYISPLWRGFGANAAPAAGCRRRPLGGQQIRPRPAPNA